MNTFILNMPKRVDRKISVEHEFEKKKFFDIEFVTPINHGLPTVSHWKTLQKITTIAQERGLAEFLFCEDDHVFTSEYSDKWFMELVAEAKDIGADMLLGGVSWMQYPIQISNNLFWLSRFNGIQFAVIFDRFYDRIISCDTAEYNIITEIVLSNLSEKIFTVYPFLSVQREFGYSDVTARNNQKGYVEGLFKGTGCKLDILNKVRNFYLTQCPQ